MSLQIIQAVFLGQWQTLQKPANIFSYFSATNFHFRRTWNKKMPKPAPENRLDYWC